MIKGKQTNKVYFSELLSLDKRFNECYLSIIGLLDKHNINYSLLKGTKDIWCRDYMPIQLDRERFIQFRYEPSYLINDLNLQSNPLEICRENRINPLFSEINIDGGNIVNSFDRAIITDRVFDENPNYSSKIKLISEIEKLLEAEIIVIPQIKTDMTGHADGHVRFIDRTTVLGNNRDNELKYWTKGMNKILKENGIEYIDIPFFDNILKEYPDNAIGCYVNYLEVQDLIVLPIFETKNNKDYEVFELMKQVFPDRKIETINYNEVGNLGGLLNCTTWTIEV